MMKSLKKGFTLVELMVVIVIIGILAALAIPRFMGATAKSKATEFKPVLKQIYTLEEAFRQESAAGALGTFEQIGWDAPGLNAALATATTTKAFFNYGPGATPVGTTVALQRAAVTAPAPVYAAGIAIATAAPNVNGITIVAANGNTLVNASDVACVITSGETFVDDGAANLQTIAGGLTQQNCP
ncbi:MAG: type II secretion system protein [Fibrobacteres bacterium]|nr:type II secretion system protein [Fibrobacterota bacterium]